MVFLDMQIAQVAWSVRNKKLSEIERRCSLRCFENPLPALSV